MCDRVPEYRRHEPEKALLHRVVREELECFLARASESGAPVARFAERDLRAYLECGVLANGFLRVHCDDCGCDRLVAFSCYLELKTIRSRREEGGVEKGEG